MEKKRNYLPTYVPHIVQLYIIFSLMQMYIRCAAQNLTWCVLRVGLLQYLNISNDPIKTNWMYCIIIQTREHNPYPQTPLCWGKITQILLCCNIFIRNNFLKNHRVVSLYTPKIKNDLNGILKKVQWLWNNEIYVKENGCCYRRSLHIIWVYALRCVKAKTIYVFQQIMLTT